MTTAAQRPETASPDATQTRFRVERPTGRALPIVVDVPHAGTWIPEDVLAEMVVGDQTLRRDLDLYVDQLWQDAPAHGATLVASHVSRYVLDLNRAPDDTSPMTVQGGQRVNKPGYYHERGVVWRTTTDGVAVMPRPMTPEQFARRIATFHTPYHDALEAEIERVRAAFGFCILLDGHSMPSMGRSGHTDTGARRADVVPGDVEGTSCGKRLTRAVINHFREQGYTVKPNNPYRGGWITRNYGRPREGVHAIQIEVNRALYMNEHTFDIKRRGFDRLRDACRDMIIALEGWTP